MLMMMMVTKYELYLARAASDVAEANLRKGTFYTLVHAPHP